MSLLFTLFLTCLLWATSTWAGVDFDAVDDSLETNTAVTTPTQLSMSMWINADTSGEGTFGRMVVFDNAGTGAAPTTGISVSATSCTGSNLRIGFRADWSGTDGTWESTCGDITTDTWYHVGVTYDGSSATNDPIIYVNGASVTLSTDVNGTTAFVTASNELIVGNVDDGTRTFDGIIDEVGIWNGILGADAVAKLATGRVRRLPVQIGSTSLFRYWPLDDEEDGSSADADTFQDYSSNRESLTGSDGANNTGLTATASRVLSYP